MNLTEIAQTIVYFQRKDVLEMGFPIDIIESITGSMKIVTQSVDIARWIANKYQQHKNSRQSSETQDDESFFVFVSNG